MLLFALVSPNHEVSAGGLRGVTPFIQKKDIIHIPQDFSHRRLEDFNKHTRGATTTNTIVDNPLSRLDK